MAETDFQRMIRAEELRKKAERYRYLTGCTRDETTVEILKKMSRDCDREADEIEKAIAASAATSQHGHAA